MEIESEIAEELSESVLMELLGQINGVENLILLMKYKEKHSITDIRCVLGINESAVKMDHNIMAKSKILNVSFPANKNNYGFRLKWKKLLSECLYCAIFIAHL